MYLLPELDQKQASKLKDIIMRHKVGEKVVETIIYRFLFTVDSLFSDFLFIFFSLSGFGHRGQDTSHPSDLPYSHLSR